MELFEDLPDADQSRSAVGQSMPSAQPQPGIPRLAPTGTGSFPGQGGGDVGGGMFDDLPDARGGSGGSSGGDAPRGSDESPSFFSQMLSSHQNALTGAQQGTNPNVYHGDGKYLRKPLGFVTGEGKNGVLFYEDEGTTIPVNPKEHIVLTDPANGRLTVFERNAEWDEGATAGVSRVVSEGLLPNPLGIGKASNVALGSRNLGAYSAARAADAAEDLAAANRLNIPVPGVVFSTKPVRGLAKSLEETPLIGAPLHNSVTSAYQGMADAVDEIASGMSRVSSFDQAGHSLQTGLDRFRTAGIRKIEPPVLENLGVPSMRPVASGAMTTTDAAKRARAAEPIAPTIGADVVETSRGVKVPPPAPTTVSRTAAEDLSKVELDRIIRAPSSQTSFAARQEALYQRAFNNLPDLYTSNGKVNASTFGTPNAAAAAEQMLRSEAAARISGGVLEGRFGPLVEALANKKVNFTLDSLRAARTEVGRALNSFGDYDARLDRTQLRTLYGSISKDLEMAMRDLANRAILGTRQSNKAGESYFGGPNQQLVTPQQARDAVQALRDYRIADMYTRVGIRRMDNFMSILDANNPERAVQRLVQAALEGGKGNQQLVSTALGALRAPERNDVASLILRNMGKPVPSARGVAQETGFSPQSFTTRWNAMDQRSRDMLFGGEHARAINDLYRVANRIANIEALANVSRSGVNAVNMSGLVGLLMSLARGDVVLPAVVGAGGAAMSAILSSPLYARWATRYMQLKAEAIRSPQQVNAALVAHINRLSQMASKDITLAPLLRAVEAENGVSQRDRRDRQ
jgi:hypothetical protein